jgi:hypothetical protein
MNMEKLSKKDWYLKKCVIFVADIIIKGLSIIRKPQILKIRV